MDFLVNLAQGMDWGTTVLDHASIVVKHFLSTDVDRVWTARISQLDKALMRSVAQKNMMRGTLKKKQRRKKGVNDEKRWAQKEKR